MNSHFCKFAAFILLTILDLSLTEIYNHQCVCDTLKPCVKKLEDAVEPCLNKCMHKLGSAGGDPQSMKSCLVDRKPKIKKTWNCIKKKAENSCTNDSTDPPMVSHISFRELRKRAHERIRQSVTPNLMMKITPLMDAGKGFLECTKDCTRKASDNCFKALDCALKLPENFLKMVKQCAVDNGFNTKKSIKMCKCLTETIPGNIGSICAPFVAQLSAGW